VTKSALGPQVDLLPVGEIVDTLNTYIRADSTLSKTSALAADSDKAMKVT
jgi:hypothetical protein